MNVFLNKIKYLQFYDNNAKDCFDRLKKVNNLSIIIIVQTKNLDYNFS